MMNDSKQENQHANSADLVKKRGRPKCFNEQQALEKAMILFWQFGYEGTSISDLTQALNITAPSLYGTFGDKAALFEKCIEYYSEHEVQPAEKILQAGQTAKIAMELYLYDSIQHLVQANKPKGCMVVVATMNCSQQNQTVQEQLKQRRAYTKTKIMDRLDIGVQNSEIESLAHAEQLTDFYMTLLQGMTIQARDGMALTQLQRMVSNAMKSWGLLAQGPISMDHELNPQ